MPTQEQIFHELVRWCLKWCFNNVPPQEKSLTAPDKSKTSPVESLFMFSKSSDTPQESQIDPAAASYFERHHQAALEDLKTMFSTLKLSTDLTSEHAAENKKANLKACSGMSDRPHHVEELHGLLIDLERWNDSYRGTKAILNVFKLVRALSR
ncbi:MAG: hypothetical protein WBP93_10530 [Pyrinomonadaceae bacterium]